MTNDFDLEKTLWAAADKMQYINEQSDSLTQIRDVLLPKLMNGEIDASKINCG